MKDQFTPVTDIETIDTLMTRSEQEPVLLFKHDTACPISAGAHRHMTQIDGDISLIDVELDKDIASEVAERTGVRHESPQVIVLRNGKAVWSASRHDITADAVRDALSENA